MEHSDIGVKLYTHTYPGLEDAAYELRRMQELENARKVLEKNKEACFTEDVLGDLLKERL